MQLEKMEMLKRMKTKMTMMKMKTRMMMMRIKVTHHLRIHILSLTGHHQHRLGHIACSACVISFMLKGL